MSSIAETLIDISGVGGENGKEFEYIVNEDAWLQEDAILLLTGSRDSERAIR